MTRFVEQYPILLGEKVDERVVDALEKIEEAQKVGFIRNAEYNSLKDVFSRAISRAWDEVVRPFYLNNQFRVGDNSQIGADANDLYYSRPSSLYSLLSFGKKLNRLQNKGMSGSIYADFLAAAQSYHDELIGLAQSFQDLKGKIVKGRAPSMKATSVNPDQVRGTCPVCFKVHAVVKGGMARHGYQLPGGGLKTANCEGADSQPYEVSDSGVKAHIARLEALIANTRKELAGADGWDSLTYMKKNNPFPVTICKDEYGWEARKAQKIKQLNAMIEEMTRLLPFYQKKVEEWVKKPLLKMDGTLVHQ